MSKKMKLFIGIMIVLIIALLIIFGIKIFNEAEIVEEVEAEVEEQIEEEPIKEEIKIFKGNSRPIAFMIDNNVNAQPQSSLNKAYSVYEIIVEGGETRLMALFKGVDVSNEDVIVGPIRSARHYFIDYAMENDAVYVHLGQSPQAETYIKQNNIADINGQIYDTGKAKTNTSLFWRERSKKAPHNAYTSIASIAEICDKKKYTTTSSKESVLNYTAKDITFEDRENVSVANTVSIPYGTNHVVKYIFDEITGRYTRYSKNKKQTDGVTGADITTKNIIIEFIKNTTLNDGENKDRQDLDNLTNAEGYYITNGKAIPITCKKQSKTAQTKYVDKQGNEIEVNDGNTWINICPIDSKVTLE